MRDHHWTDRLSEYLDGDLSETERAACALHLAECDPCGQVLSDLTRVKARLAALPGAAPSAAVWTGIQARIEADRVRAFPPRRLSFSLPQLAAAAVAFLTLGASVTWFLLAPAGNANSPITFTASDRSPMVSVQAFDRTVDPALADLQRILEEGRGVLDTATVRILEENLVTIDRAITEARAAVSADPANPYLTRYLAQTVRRKLDLLRQAADLVAQAS